jgi:hypothetical protein
MQLVEQSKQSTNECRFKGSNLSTDGTQEKIAEKAKSYIILASNDGAVL